LLNQIYADKSMVKGVNLSDPSVQEKIYQQYLKAYKKGVFNYIKEDTQGNGQVPPRKYFSGGYGTKPGFVSVGRDRAQFAKVARRWTTGLLFVLSTLALSGQQISRPCLVQRLSMVRIKP